MTTVGFVGLGSMGAPIAGRLLQGSTVYGTNRTKAKAAELIERGLIWRDTPREVAQAAQVVFSMVTDDAALAAITSGRDGILAGYQLDRAIAASMGFDRSNGCSYACSPLMVPMQRMANVSLRPSASGDATVEDLVGGVERGIYVVGDKSWSIDMQRYNFQFTGQRFYKITGGRLAGQVCSAGASMIDAPVSGSVPAAGNGTLSIMVGGPEAAFLAAEPLLRQLGRSVTHVGGNGQGLLLKLAINISLAAQMLAFSEGVLLAERSGIDPALAVRAMSDSPIGSPMLQARAPLVLDLPEQAWFDVRLMHKDIRLALEAARDANAPLPAASVADSMLGRGVARCALVIGAETMTRLMDWEDGVRPPGHRRPVPGAGGRVG